MPAARNDPLHIQNHSKSSGDISSYGPAYQIPRIALADSRKPIAIIELARH
jgi:hypothetical protein